MLYKHIRNYGCRVNVNYSYKDLRVVVLENKYLRISVLADKGANIFEFLYKPYDTDFMWLSPWGINTPSKFIPTVHSKVGNFDDYHEGGWFECFPNFSFGTNYKGAEIGLHGEVCLLPWDFQILEDDVDKISIKFMTRTHRTPFYIEKILTLKSNDPKLYITEKIKNEGYVDMDFIWCQHPTFGGEFLDDSIIINIPDNEVKYVWKHNDPEDINELNDINIQWPKIKGFTGKEIDFSRSPTLEDDEQSIDQICLGELKDSWYAVTNTDQKVGFGMRWENDIFPYLWVMRMYGKGNKTGPWWGRASCMALELMTSFAPGGLDNAINNNTAIKIKPQCEFKTSFMAIAYEKDSGVDRIDSQGNVY